MFNISKEELEEIVKDSVETRQEILNLVENRLDRQIEVS
jgi:hypothetical protein